MNLARDFNSNSGSLTGIIAKLANFDVRNYIKIIKKKKNQIKKF
jgi:hypothetical protein